MNFAKLLGTPFYRTPPDGCFWYLENLTFKQLILSQFAHSINLVNTLYLMSRNVNFRTSSLQLSYYDSNSYLAWKILFSYLLVHELLNHKSLLNHNPLKSDMHFNPIIISSFLGSKFLRVKVFQCLGISGSRFFHVQVFQGPGPGSGSRF